MNKVRSIVLGFSLFTMMPVAFAEDAKPAPTAKTSGDARLVPSMRDGKPEGLKVYAIKPGGRFAMMKFLNGDTILKVDGEPVVTDAGGAALRDKVIDGNADAVVTLTRKGKQMELKTTKK